MFQLLLFYYIVPYDTKIRVFHYILGDNKKYDYEGFASEIPNDLYHNWVHELYVEDGYLTVEISSEPIEDYLKD